MDRLPELPARVSGHRDEKLREDAGLCLKPPLYFSQEWTFVAFLVR